MAQLERENILQRQKEGIVEAKKRGVKFGRAAIEKPENYKKVVKACSSGKISIRQGAELLQVSHTTLYKWIKKEKADNVKSM